MQGKQKPHDFADSCTLTGSVQASTMMVHVAGAASTVMMQASLWHGSRSAFALAAVRFQSGQRLRKCPRLQRRGFGRYLLLDGLQKEGQVGSQVTNAHSAQGQGGAALDLLATG